MSSQNLNKRVAWLQGPPSSCELPAGRMLEPWRLILLGAPGVGKGTQADLLHQRLQACHLSTGDVFRAAAGRPECDQTPAMQKAQAFMRRGELVPDTTVWEMVRERAACLLCKGGFILDGFPRTLAQAELLAELMTRERLDLTAVVNYELPTSVIIQRLGGRRTCKECKAVYHLTERPPAVDGRCDRCHGTLFQRDDDRPESIQVRLEAYNRSTAPLIDFFRKAGLLIRVSAAGTPQEILELTLTDLKSLRAHQLAS